MNARRTLLATTFVLAATVVSNTAAANTQTAQHSFDSMVKHYIDIASAEVTYELKLEIENDVLTASHHATPSIDASALLASVNVTDIKEED